MAAIFERGEAPVLRTQKRSYSAITLHAARSGTHIVLLPGWLGWSKLQYAPFMSLFSSVGPVTGIDYDGPHFCADQIAKGVAKGVAAKVRRGERVMLFGSSMGAMLSVFVLEQLMLLNVDTSMVSAVLIDPPSGAMSLKAVPNLSAPVVAKLEHLPTWLNGGFTNSFFQKAFCSGSAPDAPIQVPRNRAADADAYRAEVQQRCWEGQQGFTPTLSFGELAWMTRVGRDGSLARALRAINGKFSVMHVACTGSPETGQNAVVSNPLAQSFYQKHLADARFLVLDTNHTNYEEFAPKWRRFLRDEVFANHN